MEFKISTSTATMNGGEDYELLFTIPQAEYEKIKNLPDITAIGITTEDKNVLLISKMGAVVPIQAQGWNHLS